MEPQLINNFAAAAFCAFKDFGTSYEGDCNMELIRTEQVSNTGNISEFMAGFNLIRFQLCIKVVSYPCNH